MLGEHLVSSGVCEPSCCWAMLCILFTGWQSRILVHVVKKKQEDIVSAATDFSRQRVTTSVFKPSSLLWGVRGRQW